MLQKIALKLNHRTSLHTLIAIFLAILFGYAINAFPPFHIGLLLLFFTTPFFLVQPKFLLYFFIVIVLFFPNVGYGVSEQESVLNIYWKGTGVFHFSIVNMLLWLVFIFALFQKGLKKQEWGYCNLYKLFLLFNGLFMLFILWGIGKGISIWDATSYYGVINVTNMTLLVIAMLVFVNKEEELDQLKLIFIVSVTVRGIWGIIRFFFFGGDPANPYATLEKISVKVTFFDIGDSLIACIALFYAAWVLMNKHNGSSKKATLFYLVVIICLFNIVFSYRRTGWLGLVFAALWFATSVTKGKRLVFLASALSIFIPVLSIVSLGRFGLQKGEGVLRLFPDVFARGSFNYTQGRFVELYMAIKTIKNNLLFGVGPWGGYQQMSNILIFGGFEGFGMFTHSAVIHMLLKMGVIGLLVFLAMFIGYAYFWITKRYTLSSGTRGFAEASFAGFLFFVPDMLLGTPIIEFRHMALLGFCIAIPYISYNIKPSS
ncbi:MAG: O-antigen ligase domain-containing protein [Nitrospirae bacterium]|nr:MAG: O-antigen ligase domain-containing protein [Nitrospirota bacterium]